MMLAAQLRLEDVDPKKLCEDWFASTGEDWRSKERDFVELLYHSIGMFCFKYDDFPRGNAPTFILQQRDETDIPAMEATYLNNYDGFLDRLFYGYNFSESFSSIGFVSSVGDAVRQLMRGTYDSYRVIAARTGMKLMGSCFKILKTFPASSFDTRDSQESALLSSNNMDASGIPGNEASKKKITQIIDSMVEHFFRSAIRDVCQEVRDVVYYGMLEWSAINPAILLESRWHVYITFGLQDDRELYMLSVLRNLFQENIDVAKQRKLFICIQKKVMHHLVESGRSSCISMEILSSASRFLNIPSDFLEIIYEHIFHPNKTIAVGAANFLFHSKLSANGPVKFLESLVTFNCESAEFMAVSSEELLIDSFCSIMIQFVRWEHWLDLLISNPSQYILSSTKLFINYVRKVTTNYCPSGRSMAVNRISTEDLVAAKDSFTMFFSTQFSNILTIDKIQNNPEAMSLIIRSMTYFSKKISSKVALGIVSQLSLLIRSHTSPGIIASCWSVIEHLKVVVTLDITSKIQFCSLWNTLRSHVIKDFMDFMDVPSSQPDSRLIELKMLGLIKSGESSDSVWDSCYAKLQWLIDEHPRSASISIVLRVLYNIVFHQYKLMDDSSQNQEEEENGSDQHTNRCSPSTIESSQDLYVLISRFSKLQNFAISLMGEQYSLWVRVEAFKVLASGLECFGKHMVEHPVFILSSGIVDDKVESLLMEFACEAMEWNPNEELVELRCCCDIVKIISPLFGSNYIDIYKLCNLLALTTTMKPQGGHVERHGVEVMSALKLFMNNFPNSGVHVAIAIFKTIVILIKNTNSENEDLSLIKKTLEYWKMYVDFEKVILLPDVRQSLDKLFDYMYNQTGLETYKSLSKSWVTPSQFGTSVSPSRSIADGANSEFADRPPTWDSVVTYSAFQAESAALGHSTFHEPVSSLCETIGAAFDLSTSNFS